MSCERGISLIELSVVVAILGVIALIVMPNLSASSIQRLELSTQRVVDALQFARSEALRTGQLTGVLIDVNDNVAIAKDIAVFVPDTSASPFALDHFVTHPLSKQPYDQWLGTAVGGSGVAFSDGVQSFKYDGVTDTRNYVFFDAIGAPVWLEDGERYRLVNGSIHLVLGKLDRQITIESVTGKVQVQ